MRAYLGFKMIFIGVLLVVLACNHAPSHVLFLIGTALIILGWSLLPSESEVQDQFRPLGFRSGPRVRVWTRRDA